MFSQIQNDKLFMNLFKVIAPDNIRIKKELQAKNISPVNKFTAVLIEL